MSDAAWNAGTPPLRRHAVPPRTVAMALLVLIAASARPVIAREPVPFAARTGLEIAAAAAWAWSQDAMLVYIENDEPLGPQGTATRWGYLFHSPALRKSRAYSVRDGRILAAENLEMLFDAPPVAEQWIDSGAALEVAENGPGGAFRRQHGGRLSAMLLMRSAFEDGDPDRTTWTLVYAAPDGPSLFVVVDAAEGKVRRTWRG